ncbi:MAG: PHP domain-containing protein [Halanaerobiaceae bacterium]
MKKYRIDLHIHTVLSPCADLLMTPGQIIEQALGLGLDIIAITDHNATGNLRVALKLAKVLPLEIIPGMELETREEVHLLCLFPDLERALDWQEIVNDNLPDRENREDIFGPQLLTDEEDRFIGRETRLLSTATFLSLEEAVEGVTSRNGLIIPSHIERTNGLINNLGFIPPELEDKFSLLEVNAAGKETELCEKFPFLKEYTIISSSDAHHPDQIGNGIKIELQGTGLSELIGD